MIQVVIFGTSLLARESYEVLNNLERYRVAAFTDNNSAKWGTELFGIPVIEPESLRGMKDVIVIIGSSYRLEIGKQLEQSGITNYCDDIHRIIEKLSEEERENIKRKLAIAKLQKINLDYKMADIDIQLEEKNIMEEEANDRFLVVCGGGYPSKENPSSCAFAHRRVLCYLKEGLKIDVYSFLIREPLATYEYEGVRVYKGDYLGLEKLLNTKKYKKILIHFVSQPMIYSIYRTPMRNCSMLIWCHGADVERWSDKYFNYSEDELENKRKNMDNEDRRKMSFLKEMFCRDNASFIFVSKYLKNRAYKNVGILPKNYSVIHNYIDSEIFEYKEKNMDYRKKIISIKSHSSKMYSNDLTAKAILELSKKPFFKDLTICLCGEGRLWDENFGELERCNFENVVFKRKMFTSEEMKEEFSEYGICLSPTRRDTQGVTAGEAMSAGLCVISCNTAAIGEFMDEECASLYEYDNYMQMAEEIEFLYYHPDEFKKKAENGAKRVRSQCGYNETIAKEIELIRGE